jgi:hypothetical protein
MRWSEMNGDSRTRFCEHCQLHVQNLSAISQRGIARVLARSEREQVCVTYKLSATGTLVTRWDSIINSVVGPFRRGFAWVLAACVPIVLSACQTQSQPLGQVGPGCKTPQQKRTASVEQERVVLGGI